MATDGAAADTPKSSLRSKIHLPAVPNFNVTAPHIKLDGMKSKLETGAKGISHMRKRASSTAVSWSSRIRHHGGDMLNSFRSKDDTSTPNPNSNEDALSDDDDVAMGSDSGANFDRNTFDNLVGAQAAAMSPGGGRRSDGGSLLGSPAPIPSPVTNSNSRLDGLPEFKLVGATNNGAATSSASVLQKPTTNKISVSFASSNNGTATSSSRPSNAKPTADFIVFGAAELPGMATVMHLCSLDPKSRIRAIQDPKSLSSSQRPIVHPLIPSVGSFKTERVSVVSVDSLQSNALVEAASCSASCALVVPPYCADCVARTKAIFSACVAARVSTIVFISLAATGTKTLVGEWYQDLEAHLQLVARTNATVIKRTCVLRRTLLFDDELSSAPTIKHSHAFYGPLSPRSPGTRVAVTDVGRAAATVMLSPEKHAGATYTLCSAESFTMLDLSVVWGDTLGRAITYRQVPWKEAFSAALTNGFAEWEVRALLETLEAQEHGEPSANIPLNRRGDFEAIMATKPLSIREWCSSVKKLFAE